VRRGIDPARKAGDHGATSLRQRSAEIARQLDRAGRGIARADDGDRRARSVVAAHGQDRRRAVQRGQQRGIGGES
jgi:hypothetical protein